MQIDHGKIKFQKSEIKYLNISIFHLGG